MLNKKEMANRFGVTVGTIVNWTDKGMPGSKRKNGKGIYEWEFDYPKCQEWVKEFKSKKKKPAADGEKLTKGDAEQELIEARTAKVKYEARLKEIDVLVAEERYVDIEEVETAYAKELTKVRTKLLAIPSKIAPLVLGFDDPKQPEEIIRNEINEILADFCGKA